MKDFPGISVITQSGPFRWAPSLMPRDMALAVKLMGESAGAYRRRIREGTILEIIHETFVRLAVQGLSAMLRMPMELEKAEIAQLTYGEFIRSVPPVTSMGIVSFSPMKGAMVMELDPGPGSARLRPTPSSPRSSPPLRCAS